MNILILFLFDVNKNVCFNPRSPQRINRDFKKTTTAKRQRERRYVKYLIYIIIVHFVLRKTTKWNDQVLCSLENVNQND